MKLDIGIFKAKLNKFDKSKVFISSKINIRLEGFFLFISVDFKLEDNKIRWTIEH